MIAIIMACALVGTVILIPICGALAPTPLPPPVPIIPSVVIQEENSSMQNDDIKNQMKTSIVEKSIEVMRQSGASDEEIKEKMMQSFSMDAEAIDKLMK